MTIDTKPNVSSGLQEIAAILTPEVMAIVDELNVSMSIDITMHGPVELLIDYFNTMEDVRKLRWLLTKSLHESDATPVDDHWEKEHSSYYYKEHRHFTTNLYVRLRADRSSVCERVQVGTQIVMKADPEVLRVLEANIKQIEVEEPVYEWKCND
jgi:hypothetical protein